VLRRLRALDLLRPRDELRDLRAALERPRDERLDFLRPPPRDLLPLDLRALAIVTSPVAEFASTVRKNRAHFRYSACTVLNANPTPIISARNMMPSGRKFAAVIACVAALAGCAQPSQTPMPEVQSDADVRPVGATGVPLGYLGRTDRPNANLADAKYAVSGSRWEITTGPAHILYSPRDVATGSYTASATIEQLAKPAHPEAFGLFIAGRELDGPNQSYTYFLVRGNGEFSVRHRLGDTVHTLVPWQRNAAVPVEDAMGRATYRLAVSVRPMNVGEPASRADSVYFRVNGQAVAVLPASAMMTDGIVGLRINHNLRVTATPIVITRP
jgi:hypothetical protein